ncbi:MAG: von Willebrand factor type A domain-containing protein [Planctomycetales bacterium]|nr:von Willebrand factor type A domain-containing protein [Planctomycetales bacterium]
MSNQPSDDRSQLELEARIVASVLGEASDFESAELERLLEQRPELARLKQQIASVHSVLGEIGTLERETAEDDWKLPEEKRQALLAILDSSDSPPTTQVVRPRAGRYWMLSTLRGLRLGRTSRAVAATCMAGLLGIVVLSSLLLKTSGPRIGTNLSYFDNDAAETAEFAASEAKGLTQHFAYPETPSLSGGSQADFEVPGQRPALDALRSSLAEGPSTPFSGMPSRDSKYSLELSEEPSSRAAGFELLQSEPAASAATRFGIGEQGVQPGRASTWMADDLAMNSGQAAIAAIQLPDIEASERARYFLEDSLAQSQAIVGTEFGIQESALGYAANGSSTALGSTIEVDSPTAPTLAFVLPDLSQNQVLDDGFGNFAYDNPATEGTVWAERGGSQNELSRAEDATRWDFALGATVDADADGLVDKESGLNSPDYLRAADLYSLQGIQLSTSPQGGPAAGQPEANTSRQALSRFGDQAATRNIEEEHRLGGEAKDQLATSGYGGEGSRDYGFSKKRKEDLAELEQQSFESEEGLVLGKATDGEVAAENTVAGTTVDRGVDWYEAENKSRALNIRVGMQEDDAARQAFSTFSLHVSDVSYKLAQSALSTNQWPDSNSVRIEEFVNALDYGDPVPRDEEKVAAVIEQCIHPFLQQRNLLRISMRTAAAGRASNVPLRLTVLLDNSGSMERFDRQQIVRRAFSLLSEQLKPIDQMTLISFARQPRLLADKVNSAQLASLNQSINNLPSEGGTNMELALRLAFEKALEQQMEGAQNRVVLLTDGAVNLGNADPDSLSQMITTMRDAGIAFDAAGISAEGLNDGVLEALTRQGDGRYYLLDSLDATDDGFVRQLAGALRPSAKNVKVQVEFNPQRVGQYKLLGFEKHLLQQEDFRNDKVDAAELAAEEAGVAIYQMQVKDDGQGDVGSVSVRFQDMSSGQMVENRWPIPYEPQAPRIEQADSSLQIASAAALFAAKLKGEPLGEAVELKALSELLSSSNHNNRLLRQAQQLKTMVDQARQLSGN